MMIFGEESDRGRGRVLTAAMGKETSRRLHNFKLPCLKWSNQRFLRCMKVEPDGHVSSLYASDRRFSLGPEVGKGSVERRSNCVGGRPESVGGISLTEAIEASPSPAAGSRGLKRKSQAEFDGGHGINTIFDIGNEGSVKGQAARPWNMTKRRAVFNYYNGDGAVPVEGAKAVGEQKTNSSPLRAENRSQEVPGEVTGFSGRKKERAKFSAVLSRKEIEEDFMALTGKKAPRRPKKWPKNVRKDLDNLFPGLWLTEVTADMYKIPEAPEKTKRQ